MINWLKYKKYWKSRLAKLKGTPQSIAVGAACGIAISFTPFVGAHMMLAMIMAWVLRGNIMAALVGTTVGTLGHFLLYGFQSFIPDAKYWAVIIPRRPI